MSTENITSESAMADEPAEIIFGEAVEVRYGVCWFILTILFFQVVNRVVAAVGSPKAVPASDEWKWRNLVISWFHALIVGAWDLSCFILFPDLFQDLIAYANYYMYSMVAFSAGYFVYDFIDMYINNKLFKLWEVSIHHIAVGGMFTYNIFSRICIAYNCIALLAEVNSFFLHSRKLLQMLRVDFQHWSYKVIVYTNLVTFVIFRVIPIFGILYGMYLWRARVHVVYYVSISTSMFVMSAITPVLFYRLFKNDVLRSSNQGRKVKDISKLNHANNVNNNIKHEKVF